MRIIWIAAIAMVALSAAAKPKPFRTVRVEIRATVLDRISLLAHLDKDGKHHHMRFVEASGKNFDYRIVFSTGRKPNPSIPGNGGIFDANVHYSDTAVFDPAGAELFQFHSDEKYTNGGTTNDAAKYIIKQILLLRKIERRKADSSVAGSHKRGSLGMTGGDGWQGRLAGAGAAERGAPAPSPESILQTKGSEEEPTNALCSRKTSRLP